MTPDAIRERPDRNLALELVRVTEAAALAAAPLVGRGDKEAADQAAVDGMRFMLHSVQMDGVVVIGEGEKDEAPMLYNGEQIGDGSPPQVDIAVDPLEGTTLAAHGHAERAGRDRAVRARHDVRPGAVRVHGEDGRRAGDRGPARPRPPARRDGHAGRRAQGQRGRRRDGRRARPPAPRGGDRRDPRGRRARAPDPARRRLGGAAGRHRALARRPAVGDRRARPRASSRRPRSSASAASCSGGCGRATTPSARAALDAGYDLDRVLDRDDLVAGEDVFFSATGVTDGDVLQGVRYPSAGGATTESLVMRSRSGTIRRIRRRTTARSCARSAASASQQDPRRADDEPRTALAAVGCAAQARPQAARAARSRKSTRRSTTTRSRRERSSAPTSASATTASARSSTATS